jgi:predicted type IV restriction endonuclease
LSEPVLRLWVFRNSQLTKEAAQVVKYASVLGLRWGILTDGQHVKVYDIRVPGVQPHERLVFEVDLADYKSREDFEAQIVPPLALLAKDTITTDTGLERRAAALAIQDLLTSVSFATVAALREELKTKRLIALSSDELAELLSEILP